MSDVSTQAAPHGAKGREALEQSERKANETEPQNYREEGEADKIVEIPPIDGDNEPIKGLDPK